MRRATRSKWARGAEELKNHLHDLYTWLGSKLPGSTVPRAPVEHRELAREASSIELQLEQDSPYPLEGPPMGLGFRCQTSRGFARSRFLPCGP